MRRRFDLTPLGHPIWWGALALLLVNDDLLKGRGVVPGWLTGKLSDFAFLVVAPVLFAVLIPRRVPGRRTFAVAAVVGLFVAADLSRAVSDTVVALAGHLGLRWRLWPDPTDLLALAVLPVSVWLLRRPPDDDSAAARRARVRRERAGVVLGAIACLATSAPPEYAQHPFLHNRTGGDVGVRMTWVLRRIDCATTPEALGATLGPSDLDDPRAMTLGSGDVAALDGPPAPGTSPVGICSTGTQSLYSAGNTECVAAILEADGAAPVLMVTPKRWDLPADSALICPGPAPLSECAPHLDPDRRVGTDTVGLSNVGCTLRFEVSRTGRTEQGQVNSTIQIAPIDPAAIAARAPVTNGCRALRDSYRAIVQSSSCVSDADCQGLPGLQIPGEDAGCDIFVNRSVSAAAVETLNTEWDAMCASNGAWCSPPLPAACKAGRCAELCGGVELPTCPSSCSQFSDGPRGLCTNGWGSCLDNEGNGCTCPDGKTVTCEPLPRVDPSCPLGCRPYPSGN